MAQHSISLSWDPAILDNRCRACMQSIHLRKLSAIDPDDPATASSLSMHEGQGKQRPECTGTRFLTCVVARQSQAQCHLFSPVCRLFGITFLCGPKRDVPEGVRLHVRFCNWLVDAGAALASSAVTCASTKTHCHVRQSWMHGTMAYSSPAYNEAMLRRCDWMHC